MRKLLIVDDIPAVVDGLSKAIGWNSLGISQVFTANSAMEARGILSSQNIDVMLCDIQMPGQSGLELQEWVRAQQLPVRTIFLTSHAEFSYAQAAVKNGGFDYIVQPAPYQVIYEAVGRALQDVDASMTRDAHEALGKALKPQLETMRAGCILDHLKGNPREKNYRKLVDLGEMPAPGESLCTALLYIQKWTETERWEPGLLEWSLQNMVDEIFAPYDVKPITVFVEERTYCVVMKKGGLTTDALERQLYYLQKVCSQYMNFEISAFFDGEFTMSELRERWNGLKRKNAEHIVDACGVFNVRKIRFDDHVYHMPEIKQWATFLTQGYPKAFSENANALIDSMILEDKMNRHSLVVFYLDFLDMLYATWGGERMAQILDTPEKSEIYRNGMRSIDAMRRLIAMVADSVSEKADEMDPQVRVHQIMKFINEHLDTEFKREELAASVNLSPDYMTRIFKAETGQTIKEYVISQKMQTARSLLRTTSLPVSFVAAKVGYSNFSHFSSTYKKEFGVSPQNDRTEQTKAEI